MESSEQIGELTKALSAAQALIEHAEKDRVNPHFKNKYATLESIINAIKKPMTDQGLSFVQVVHPSEASAVVETIILHESGEWLSCGHVGVPVAQWTPQGYGSALTYGRRYSLSSALGVGAEEDDDANQAQAEYGSSYASQPPRTNGRNAPRPAPATTQPSKVSTGIRSEKEEATDKVIKRAKIVFGENEVGKKLFADYLGRAGIDGVAGLEQATMTQLTDIMRDLKSKPAPPVSVPLTGADAELDDPFATGDDYANAGVLIA